MKKTKDQQSYNPNVPPISIEQTHTNNLIHPTTGVRENLDLIFTPLPQKYVEQFADLKKIGPETDILYTQAYPLTIHPVLTAPTISC